MKVELKFESRDNFNLEWPVEIQELFRQNFVKASVAFVDGSPVMRLDAQAQDILEAFHSIYLHFWPTDIFEHADNEALVRALESRGYHVQHASERFL